MSVVLTSYYICMKVAEDQKSKGEIYCVEYKTSWNSHFDYTLFVTTSEDEIVFSTSFLLF